LPRAEPVATVICKFRMLYVFRRKVAAMCTQSIIQFWAVADGTADMKEAVAGLPADICLRIKDYEYLFDLEKAETTRISDWMGCSGF
jgi:hypothetical protein